MRLFIAVDVEEPSIVSRVAMVKSTIQSLNVPVKLVEDENLHITLLFIGEVSEYAAESIKEALSTLSFRSFKIKLKGIGAFPSPGRPRVVWVGVDEGEEELVKLHREVLSRVRKAGIQVSKQEFKPHLTIGRVKGTRNITALTKMLMEYSEEEFGYQVVNEVRLKQSILTPKGPIYKTLYSVKASE